MLYTPKHFIIEEFIPKDIFEKYGQCWQIMDERLIITADQIRDHFGKKMTINNWKWNGQFSQRGIRSFNSKVGAALSQHKFGRAIDFDIEEMSAEEVRTEIIKNKDKFLHITAMETDINWVHIDVRYLVNQERIKLFKP